MNEARLSGERQNSPSYEEAGSEASSLRESLTEARAEVELHRAELVKVCAEVNVLRAALAVFAVRENWSNPEHPQWDLYQWLGEADEPWAVAREALGEEGGA